MRERKSRLLAYQKDYAAGDRRAQEFMRLVRAPANDGFFRGRESAPATVAAVQSSYEKFIETGKFSLPK